MEHTSSRIEFSSSTTRMRSSAMVEALLDNGALRLFVRFYPLRPGWPEKYGMSRDLLFAPSDVSQSSGKSYTCRHDRVGIPMPTYGSPKPKICHSACQNPAVELAVASEYPRVSRGVGLTLILSVFSQTFARTFVWHMHALGTTIASTKVSMSKTAKRAIRHWLVQRTRGPRSSARTVALNREKS